MHTSKATLKRFLSGRVLAFQITAVLLVSLAALLIFVSSDKVPVSPIVFGHLAVPTSTNASFVCVTLTNQSKFAVVYLIDPPEVSSNGIWSGPPHPLGRRLTKLLARQSGVMVVDAASTNENTRVPVLWGYHDDTPGGPRWRQLAEDFVSRVRGHGEPGLLYTNYLTNLRP
jgi:hypothetical protein